MVERHAELVLGEQQTRQAVSRTTHDGDAIPRCRGPCLTAGMLPWRGELAGRLDEHVITSELLRGNPLGDPHERPLWVYVPPGYDDTQPSAIPRST